jgi:type I restriction enzyme S subunit
MTKVKFEDVATRVNTREDRLNTSLLYYVGGEHIESNEMLVQGCGLIKGSTIGPMFYCGFKKGDILLVSRNPHLRKASMVEFDGICSEKTFVLGTKDSKVLLQEFLALVMQSDDFWNYCEEHKSGGVNYFLNWSTLAKYEFYLPSIQEQKEIADKVWSAYRLKESYKKLLVATDEMVKSQFIEMFENVESYCKLEDLVSDTFPGEWGSEPISENAIKVIRTTNFTNEGYLDLTDVVTRDIEPKKVVRKKLKQGDTILERSGGTKDNPVGRVVFFDEIGDYLPNNFTQVLRPKESVNPVYLFYALYNSYNLNKAAMRAMASQTTGIQNLSMSDFMAKFIVLPSRNEQNKFEQIYRQADKSKSVIQKALVYLNDIQSDELGKIA